MVTRDTSAGARRSQPASLSSALLPVCIDSAALLALLALVALAFYPVYGTAWLFVTVLGFGVVGIAVGVVSAKKRFGIAVTAMLGVGAWFVAGGFLTMPSSSLGGVIPTGRTLLGLVAGPVTAWRDMLTLDAPIGETFNLLTVPGLVALAAALSGTVIALRSTMPMLAWVPAGCGYVIGVIVGSQAAFQPVLVGAGFFIIVLLWTTYQRAALRGSLVAGVGRLRPLRALFGVAALALASLLAVSVVPMFVGEASRQNIREAMEPPIDVERYASPLQAYRANITEDRTNTLMTVTGAATGDIIRLATLDKYDGLSYSVSSLDDDALEATTFTRVGQWIADDGPGVTNELTMEIGDYSSVWTPTVGRTTRIEFTGERRVALSENFYYNDSSGTGVDTASVQPRDSYNLTAKVVERPSDADIEHATAGEYALPESTNVPDIVQTRAQEIAGGAATSGSAVLALEGALREGYFSHGQPDEAESLPGHSERRLINLLQADYMVGDHEQYAVAMALMARSLGIPARVIYGYQVGTTPTITGDQVGAWTEVYFDKLGWVTFDPTPPESQKLTEVPPPKPPEQQPFVENPPPPPLQPDVPPPDDQVPIDPGTPFEDPNQIDWARVGAFALLAGIPLLTVVLPIALVIGLKLRRRSRRRHDPVVANRIAGAWSELVDRARDIGRSPSAAATRSEQAQGFAEEFSKVEDSSDPVGLAKEADWLVFAPGDPNETRAQDYWVSTSQVQRGMRKSVSGVRWLVSFLSTKSFRKIR